MKEVGEITRTFDKIGVAVVKVSGNIKQGDKIKIKGSSTDFEQTAGSMQIDKTPIKEAKKGQMIGLKVNNKVKAGDKIYTI
ncbi:MAG: translation elongation factor-like protein [Candidatus Nanoarchaeia archaeon]|nr:translation elongation factor-like protein [Candidatus Nanoarchaeia archaeon]